MINKQFKQLNAEGLRCPLPLLKMKLALKELALGEVLIVTTTDPGSITDFKAFTDQVGHQLVTSSEQTGVYKFTIKKTKD